MVNDHCRPLFHRTEYAAATSIHEVARSARRMHSMCSEQSSRHTPSRDLGTMGGILRCTNATASWISRNIPQQHQDEIRVRMLKAESPLPAVNSALDERLTTCSSLVG